MNQERHPVQSATPAPNDPSPDRAGNCARCTAMADEDAGDMLMLAELADMGMALARAIQGRVIEQIEEGEPLSVGGDPGLVFSRIAKVVRQSIALKRKIAEDGHAREEKAAAEAAALQAEEARRAASTENWRIRNVKKRVKRSVERAIGDAADEDDYEDLIRDLNEKLDDYEADGEFNLGTITDIIDRLGRELGLRFDEDEDAEPEDEDDPSDGMLPDGEAANDDPPDDGPVLAQAWPKYAGRKGHDPP